MSGGRILELHEIIPTETLEEIQMQLLYIMFPDVYRIYHKDKVQIIKYENAIGNMVRQVANLKTKIEKLSKKIHDLESASNNVTPPTETYGNS